MKISVAYIRSPRGFKGELAATLYRSSSRTLEPGLTVTLSKAGRSLDCEVEYIKSLRKGIALKLIEINDEETAESWRNGEILVESDRLQPLDESEYYHYDLEGAEVFEEDGKRIGKVKSVENGAGNDLLIVTSKDDEIMIPFVKSIVKTVDIENKKIIIEKIEGLY